MTERDPLGETPVEAELRRMGARFSPEVLAETRALYRPLVQQLPWASREGIYDLPYGEAGRQRLDVYPSSDPNAPVLLFIHGGGFVGGDKRADPDFYGNVGRYFAAHGYLAIACNYRLAPDATWPSGNEDMAAVMAWIRQNAAAHGGDPDRIVVLGQSAGASHAAGYLFDPRSPGLSDRSIRAAALFSGFYAAKPGMLPGPQRYYGDNSDLWQDRSPISHVTADHPPLLLSVAEYDPGQIAEQSLELALAVCAADRRPPRLHWFEGHNHVSTVHGLGVGEDHVGRTLRNFFSLVVQDR